MSLNTATQKGSMLVISLFVIIVLGLLGLTLTRLLSSASETVIYEIVGQRALNAARAGIECALADRFASSGTSCINPVSKDFEGVTGLENCSYVVSNAEKSVDDGAKSYTFITFTSTGQCATGNIIVTKSLYIDAMESN